MPGRPHILLEPLKPVFYLDGFEYYYQDAIYYAVKPVGGRYYAIESIKQQAAFSLDSDSNFVKPITEPTVVQLMRMRRTIQVHQVMSS